MLSNEGVRKRKSEVRIQNAEVKDKFSILPLHSDFCILTSDL